MPRHITLWEEKRKEIDLGKYESMKGYTGKADRLDLVLRLISCTILQEVLSCPEVGVCM